METSNRATVECKAYSKSGCIRKISTSNRATVECKVLYPRIMQPQLWFF